MVVIINIVTSSHYVDLLHVPESLIDMLDMFHIHLVDEQWHKPHQFRPIDEEIPYSTNLTGEKNTRANFWLLFCDATGEEVSQCGPRESQIQARPILDMTMTSERLMQLTS